MVSVCAGCNDYNPWTAILIGAIAAAAFIALHYLMLKLKIDDPLDAVAGTMITNRIFFTLQFI